MSNRKAPIKRPDDSTIVAALQKANGIVTGAAIALGCSRQTLHRWISESDSLKDECDSAREQLIDIAESALLKKIKKGDIAAIIFCLKTQGRNRGYSERHEINLS
ncbi:hypothetical protein GYB59_24275, partial [bacterium]|nr:hypothetical protein [bacterium]